MIKLSKAISSRSLLLLFCFTLFIYLPGCGGSSSSGGGGEDVTYTLTITTSPAVDSFDAGEIVTITATVTDSNGLAASGQAVTFTMFRNNSGGTLTVLDTGTTDANGEAQATYTLGSNSSTEDVTDTIEISIPGSSETITITRKGRSYTLVVTTTPAVDSFKAGEIATITATITDNTGAPASGQAVTFNLFRNNTGGTLAVVGTGTTDANGKAQATYTVGFNNRTENLVDTIEVSVPGSLQTITISREEEIFSLTVSTDATTLAAAEAATITATVTDGTGTPVSGQAVTFEVTANASGGSLTIAGTGVTDVNGVVEAFFTAGSLSPDSAVTDTIQISIPTDEEFITITRVTGTSTDEPAFIDLAASPTSIKSDGSTTSTITVNALNDGNAVLTGILVSLSTSSGILSAPSVTTPGTVILSCGSDKTNRTATITATATTSTGEITQQIPVQIVGSTVTLISDTSSISTIGSANLTATVKDAGDNVVSGTDVIFTQAGIDGSTGSVTFDKATYTTDINGQVKAIVTGHTNGAVTITATALGAAATTDITIIDAATVFYIDQQRLDSGSGYVTVTGNPNPTAMYINVIPTPTTPNRLEIRVNAPDPTANVVFATTTGTLTDASNAANTGGVITVAVDGSDKATAYLTTTQAGVATVNVYDAANSSKNDSLTVAMTSANADRITIQASPTAVSKSVGTTTGSSTLIAMVRDSSGFPVGGAPVAFSIVNPTGGGETISPVVVMTAATTAGGLNLGEARTTFTSGSLPSGTTGIQIRASVVGKSINTGTPPSPAASGPDATIVIGGEAGSVSFGIAPYLSYYNDAKTDYVQAMSVLVSDANGNPAPAGTVVTLSLWPIAWSTGGGCTYDADSWIDHTTVDDDSDPLTDSSDDDGIAGTDLIVGTGTFWTEDKNENEILDATEDGWRCYYADLTQGTCVTGGKVDGFITAVNSAAGTVPATVTTDENGVANFDLIYPITSSIWTVVRVRASTIVQGTETVGQVIFRLTALLIDTSPCKITGSPYDF